MYNYASSTTHWFQKCTLIFCLHALTVCSDFWPKTACDGVLDAKFDNGTCYSVLNDGHNWTQQFEGLWDRKLAAAAGIRPVLPSEEYYLYVPLISFSHGTISCTSTNDRACSYHVLGVSPGIQTLGGLQWRLLLSLLGGWSLAYFSVIKGVKSSGKVGWWVTSGDSCTTPYFACHLDVNSSGRVLHIALPISGVSNTVLQRRYARWSWRRC